MKGKMKKIWMPLAVCTLAGAILTAVIVLLQGKISDGINSGSGSFFSAN